MPNPTLQLAQAHSQRAQEDPVGFLGDPHWVAANLAYFKDVGYFESRTKLVGGKPPTADRLGPAPRTPKAKGAQKAAAKATAKGGGEAP